MSCCPSLLCTAGATDGIGRAYAEELASRGLNIVLISRNQEKLQTVARDIADAYRVETDVIVADFSSGREIYDRIREALKDRDIGILVNNVGVFYPYPQYFTQVSEDTLWDIVNVNIAAASLLVRIVLPGMVERKKGAVVTISSGSCCKPTPQLAAFSASKVGAVLRERARRKGLGHFVELFRGSSSCSLTLYFLLWRHKVFSLLSLFEGPEKFRLFPSCFDRRI